MFVKVANVEKSVIINLEMSCIPFALQPSLCETNDNLSEVFGEMILKFVEMFIYRQNFHKENGMVCQSRITIATNTMSILRSRILYCKGLFFFGFKHFRHFWEKLFEHQPMCLAPFLNHSLYIQ